MNKLARYYRELMASVTARLNNGERDLDSLVLSARKTLQESSELTQKEIEQVIQAVQRDLEEFARSYNESQDEFTDSVFMRVIKESLWQELADITDKTQLEWREIFTDVNHHGVYHSGEVVGLGNLVCENCHHHIAFYTPEVLPLCPKCSHDLFHRQPFQP
ncbi:zinc ribbon-containing protein [Pectobacterium versatile]|uniref:zinc ribbon-containing protein n=1 Tax=Pectobacterium versatile TaxID=2488639 RepID=UPI001B3A3657|nr:zinc ribbon-containing protein [Pectobacterium versatile]MBQ4770404.1 zinc ribbon-containing protein [Pectobacterium versatile]MCA6927253.1 zinc ribbon-containing protein [Pectobacterium versatile]MCH5083997.1 zinc ribbon-containing protein [Pectobacterium versatile]